MTPKPNSLALSEVSRAAAAGMTPRTEADTHAVDCPRHFVAYRRGSMCPLCWQADRYDNAQADAYDNAQADAYDNAQADATTLRQQQEQAQ